MTKFRATLIGAGFGLVGGCLMCVVHELADVHPSTAIEVAYLFVSPLLGAAVDAATGAHIDKKRGTN